MKRGRVSDDKVILELEDHTYHGGCDEEIPKSRWTAVGRSRTNLEGQARTSGSIAANDAHRPHLNADLVSGAYQYLTPASIHVSTPITPAQRHGGTIAIFSYTPRWKTFHSNGLASKEPQSLIDALDRS